MPKCTSVLHAWVTKKQRVARHYATFGILEEGNLKTHLQLPEQNRLDFTYKL
jgi:hypothetical protein